MLYDHWTAFLSHKVEIRASIRNKKSSLKGSQQESISITQMFRVSYNDNNTTSLALGHDNGKRLKVGS